VIAYLWYNAIGCIGVVVIASLLNAFFKNDKAIAV
jgi:hypothetical protein